MTGDRPSAARAGADLGRRTLPVIGFLALVVVWIAVIKAVGAAVKDHVRDDGRLLAVHDVVWSLIVPLGAGVVLIYGAISVLGWWRPVFHDPRPVQRWVWWVAVIFAAGIVLGIDYSALADRGAAFTIVLLCAAMLIGFGEEGLFRAVGLTSLRRHGLTEAKVALWSSVIFGLAHVANLIGGDAKAFAQALVVAFAGYFFYLIRRVSRSNIVNSVLHGLFDFTIISGTQIIAPGHKAYPGAVLGIVVYVACGVLVLVRRRHIEPAPSAS